jgi:hypothetical protein
MFVRREQVGLLTNYETPYPLEAVMNFKGIEPSKGQNDEV